MHHLVLNVRTLALFGVVAAVAAFAGVFGGATRDAEAAIPDPTGVFCGDLTVLGLDGITLVRIEWDGSVSSITAVAYVPDDTGGADPTCQSPGAPNVPTSLTDAHDEAGVPRPTMFGTYNSGTNQLTGTLCQQNLNFAGASFGLAWTRIVFDITLADPPAKTVDANAFELRTNQSPGANPPATCSDSGSTSVISAGIDGKYLDGPSASAPTGFTSDWDGGGVLDWDELTSASTGRGDPFKTSDDAIGGVGGVAELPGEDSGSPLQSAEESGSNMTLVLALASVSAAALAAAGGAAYALRRRKVS